MKTSEEVVAGIVRDIPEMAVHEDELVRFMEKIQELNCDLVKAQGYHARQAVALRIRTLAQRMSQCRNGESQAARHEALNRIFDYVEGRVEHD